MTRPTCNSASQSSGLLLFRDELAWREPGADVSAMSVGRPKAEISLASVTSSVLLLEMSDSGLTFFPDENTDARQAPLCNFEGDGPLVETVRRELLF